MLVKIYRWFVGTLTIKLNGYSGERFINLCSHHNIYLWDIIERDSDFFCNIKVNDYKKLKQIAKKTKTIPRIEKKKGRPFVYMKNKKRKGYLVGIGLFIAIVYLLSLYIWDINIEGGHTYTPEFMTKFLKENDVYVGVKKKEIDASGIEEYIRLTFKDIGWVSVEIRGTRLYIKLKETILPQKAVTTTTPRHIIAKKDGIISSIVTRTGVPKVGIGDVVKKGDILVSGVIDVIGDNETMVSKDPVIADSDIIGKTYYEYEEKFPLEYKVKEYTGRKKRGLSIKVLNQKFNIYIPRNVYPIYDIMVSDYILHLNNDFYLPLGGSFHEFIECVEVKKKYSKDEAIIKANNQLNRYISNLKENSSIIVDNTVEITVDNNKCVAKGKIIVLESIIDYKDVLEEEWRYSIENEFSGNDN